MAFMHNTTLADIKQRFQKPEAAAIASHFSRANRGATVKPAHIARPIP